MTPRLDPERDSQARRSLASSVAEALPRRGPGAGAARTRAAPSRRRACSGGARLVALVALVAAIGCVAAPDPAAVRAGIEAPGRGERAAVADVPRVRSPRDDDCGAAVLAAALAAAGAPRPIADVRAAVHDPERGGAPASALVRYARAQDVLAVAREGWVLDDLKAWVRAGAAPVLALWAGPGLFHYVLLLGYDDDRRAVLLSDQQDEVALDYDAFFPRWCEARGWALVVASPAIVLPPGGAGLSAREVGALGWLAEERGELSAARRHYRDALARDPSFEAAANNLRNVERALAERGETPP